MTPNRRKWTVSCLLLTLTFAVGARCGGGNSVTVTYEIVGGTSAVGSVSAEVDYPFGAIPVPPAGGGKGVEVELLTAPDGVATGSTTALAGNVAGRVKIGLIDINGVSSRGDLLRLGFNGVPNGSTVCTEFAPASSSITEPDTTPVGDVEFRCALVEIQQ